MLSVIKLIFVLLMNVVKHTTLMLEDNLVSFIMQSFIILSFLKLSVVTLSVIILFRFYSCSQQLQVTLCLAL
jgi:hypothetical protein